MLLESLIDFVIAGQDYALWFDRKGVRIAQGRSAFGPGSTLVPWVNATAIYPVLDRSAYQ